MIYKKDNIMLSPFTDLDKWENYITWFEKPEIVNLTSHGIIPKTEKDFDEYTSNNGNGYICYKICIEEEKNEGKGIFYKIIHIGNVALQSINWINRSAELAIIIGEKDYHGKGIGTFAVKCMLYHAFMKMGLNRVWSGTSEKNIGMQKVFEKCGFEKEGVFRKAKFLNGEFTDIWEYAILKKDFFAMNGKDWIK
jgi:RimJ/RimL family protein N-acetyltransferase